MIVYYKLLDLLTRRGMKKTDLVNLGAITLPTLAKLSKNKSVTIDTIDKICRVLNCQPGDILEYMEDDKN